jgi:hypothetical protein
MKVVKSPAFNRPRRSARLNGERSFVRVVVGALTVVVGALTP